MSAPRQRTRIAKGIYRDQWGIAATVKVAGIQREERYPHDAALKTMKNGRRKRVSPCGSWHPAACAVLSPVTLHGICSQWQRCRRLQNAASMLTSGRGVWHAGTSHDHD
jgi:hypothetical protein